MMPKISVNDVLLIQNKKKHIWQALIQFELFEFSDRNCQNKEFMHSRSCDACTNCLIVSRSEGWIISAKPQKHKNAKSDAGGGGCLMLGGACVCAWY